MGIPLEFGIVEWLTTTYILMALVLASACLAAASIVAGMSLGALLVNVFDREER